MPPVVGYWSISALAVLEAAAEQGGVRVQPAEGQRVAAKAQRVEVRTTQAFGGVAGRAGSDGWSTAQPVLRTAPSRSRAQVVGKQDCA